ncbi:adenosine deaminase [Modestobacter sp. I12A-02628]|uniref:Adenosine deaminase n=1 Tax=Goekera deserti TaxID=2497753 RepID=A0A7K3WA53_9ACTN|nr:adenosine deaminase [Goekera deserti]NDI49406.1 adenosine deaminase [Goekera deserti]NEL52720.1 adenosine deaminase [Goekera deserti]
MPTAHLHVHLEGSIRDATLAELAGRPLPPQRAAHPGFAAFAAANGAVRELLDSPAAFRRVAEEFCADQAAAGVRWAEVTVTAASHGERLGDPVMPLESVLEGLAAGQAAHDVEVRVLLDHPRRRSVERFAATLALARRYAGDGVVGIGFAGAESHPLTPFARLVDEAADAGVRLVHHAGEECGPASVREALEVGRADRIGHGIRALEDADLVAELRERQVPLEVCPSSNVALGLVPSLAAHPLARMRDAGLAVSVHTDVPAVTGRTLAIEHAAVRAALGWDDADLAGLARAGVRASFAPPATRDRLLAGVDAWLAG